LKKSYLFIVLLLLSMISIFIGVSDLKPQHLLNLTSEQSQILFASRLPRLASIVISGMSMGVAGLIMQQLTRNKFVSPTTAGTLDSARMGILVSMLLFTSASPLVKTVIAFAFALLGTFIFMKILDRVKFKDTIFVPLVGLMFGGIVSSITTFFAYKHDLIQNMSSWLQGNFSTILSGRYELLYLSVPTLLIAYLFANRFTIAGMGEDFSANLGLNHKQVMRIGLTIVALISSVVILTVGMIPFLGLIIPNIVSIFQGDHLKKSIAHTAMLGAIFVLICDIIGRLIIYPYEIPIGLTVGVIGSAIFLYLLLRRKTYALSS